MSFHTKSPLQLSYSEFLRALLPNHKKKLREKILKKQKISRNTVKKVNKVVDSKINFCVCQVFDSLIKMHMNLMKQITQLQVLQPKIADMYRLMLDPKTKQVTRSSLLVFIRRFFPTELNIKLEDGDTLFRYMSIERMFNMPFSAL